MGKPNPVSTARNFVSGATADGLRLEIDGAQSVAPWSTIDSISAAHVPRGETSFFIMGIEMNDGRVFMLSETEPAWTAVVDLLHLHLDDAEPFTVWGPRLLAEAAMLIVYEHGRPRGRRLL